MKIGMIHPERLQGDVREELDHLMTALSASWKVEHSVDDRHQVAPVFNARVYGAKGDGSTDDGGAIQAAINEATSGGTVFLPSGTYLCSRALIFDKTTGVTFSGGNAASDTATRTKLIYTGTGPHAIAARASKSFSLRDLQIRYNNPAFIGTVVDLSDGGFGTATLLALVERCDIRGAGLSTAATDLRLQNCHSSTVRDCFFGGCQVAIRGQEAGGMSNGVNIDTCKFATGITTIPILAPGQAWVVNNCTFEPLSSGAAGAVDLTAWLPATALTIRNCWMGDSNNTGTWLRVYGQGLTIDGNHFESAATGIDLAGLDNTNISTGINIRGNYFAAVTTCLQLNNFTTGGHCGVRFVGNTMTGCTTSVANYPGTTAHKGVVIASNYMATPDLEVDAIGSYGSRIIGTRDLWISRRLGTDATFVGRIDGEAWARHVFAADGTMYWGPGTATYDVNLYRGGANVLRTDDAVAVGQYTTTQRNTLTVPVGTLVYNTTTGKLNVYTAAGWQEVTST